MWYGRVAGDRVPGLIRQSPPWEPSLVLLAVPLWPEGEGLRRLSPLHIGEMREGVWSLTEESKMRGERPPLGTKPSETSVIS